MISIMCFSHIKMSVNNLNPRKKINRTLNVQSALWAAMFFSSRDAITIISLGEPPSSWWCVPDRLLPRLDPIHWPSCPCQTQTLQSLPPSHHSLPQLSQHHILGVNDKSFFPIMIIFYHYLQLWLQFTHRQTLLESLFCPGQWALLFSSFLRKAQNCMKRSSITTFEIQNISFVTKVHKYSTLLNLFGFYMYLSDQI